MQALSFELAEAKLTTASQRLCNDTPSGTVQVTSWGAITLTGGNVINVVGARAEQVVSLSNFFVDLGSVPVQTVVWNICGTSVVVIYRFRFPGSRTPPPSLSVDSHTRHDTRRHPPTPALIQRNDGVGAQVCC